MEPPTQKPTDNPVIHDVNSIKWQKSKRTMETSQNRMEGIFACIKYWAINTTYPLTKNEVNTGKSETEALMYMYWLSDSEVNTSRARSEISL